MIVSIVGGHGSIARQLTPLLAARGHRVRGLVRSTISSTICAPTAPSRRSATWNLATPDDVDDALRGSDLVVFAAGAGPDSGPTRKKSLDRDGAIKAVESAVRIGATRFVIVSSMGADDPPDDDESFSVYLRAKAAADDAVRSADIDAIVVRPGRLTDEDAKNTVDIAATVEQGEIPRADVAAVLAELIEVAADVNTTIEVVSGTLPIRNAVAQLL